MIGPPEARLQRWGDGIDAPAAGARVFFPDGFELIQTVEEAIAQFGSHDKQALANTMAESRQKALAMKQLRPVLAAAIYAYTEETNLYHDLNHAMRTPGPVAESNLKRYAPFIKYMTNALNGGLPNHTSCFSGNVFRGIRNRLNPESYAQGDVVTWQAFSSSTTEQKTAMGFVKCLNGKLQGSMFIIDSMTAKKISSYSRYESEAEVLFPPNSQFVVERQVTSEQEKHAILDELPRMYDMSELDVYVLKQI